jgi:DNA-binding transcriptional MerR regulator
MSTTYYRVADVAALTGYAQATINAYISSGLIRKPRRRLANMPLFTREEVRAFVLRHLPALDRKTRTVTGIDIAGLITVAEAAKLARRTVANIHYNIARGTFPASATQVGKALMFEKRDVVRWNKANRAKSG